MPKHPARPFAASPCLRVAASILLPLLLAACSADFARRAATLPADDPLAGRYIGKWTSTQYNMSGNLECLLIRLDDHRLHAQFHATFAGVMTYDHGMTLTLQQQATGYGLSGDEDLGAMAGGVYHYEGTLQGDDFQLTYRCSGDKGTFSLARKR